MEGAKTSNVPLETAYSKIKENETVLKNNNQYRKGIGSLLYLAVNTRPDIAASISILSRNIANPTQNYWNELKRVMRYLKTTKNMELILGTNGVEKKMYADADWAEDNRDRKSTSGFIIKIFGSPISRRSRKQSTVSLSSSEAEYILLIEACQELQWMRQLMMDFNEDIKKITVFEDDQSTLKMLDHE
ncbi:hypothetical protein JTB14_029354 [Gonioctena quinquepunctata]|nr:hypothetical protein JTB14_029354 [Gonioctena quinquepunctata]